MYNSHPRGCAAWCCCGAGKFGKKGISSSGCILALADKIMTYTIMRLELRTNPLALWVNGRGKWSEYFHRIGLKAILTGFTEIGGEL